jgi:endonuclease YncB( thermonuclease family)
MKRLTVYLGAGLSLGFLLLHGTGQLPVPSQASSVNQIIQSLDFLRPSAKAEIVHVIDGDTYVFRYIGDEPGQTAHVRIRGADTPEKGDLAKCEAERKKANEATAFARRLLPRGTVVSLEQIGVDKYSRVLAVVRLQDGRDIAEVLIDAGMARPYHGEKRASWCR